MGTAIIQLYLKSGKIKFNTIHSRRLQKAGITLSSEENANISSLTTEESPERAHSDCKHTHPLVALSLLRSAAASAGPQRSLPSLIFVAGFILKPRNSADWQQSLSPHTVLFRSSWLLLSLVAFRVNSLTDLSVTKP